MTMELSSPNARVLKMRPNAYTLAFIGMTAALIVAPMFVYPYFLIQFMCFALFACAFNLLMGYVGLLSFGHAMFFGWSAYITGYAAKTWGAPPELALLLGGLFAAALGLVVGGLAIRRQGIYFATITLAFAQMLFFLAVQAPLTGGEDGIQGIPRGRLFGLFDLSHTTNLYAFVLAVFLLGFALIYRILHSPFGDVLRAIRENEPRAISLGYDTKRFKLIAFVLSSALAGVAGGLKAIAFQFATLTDVHWHVSGEVILMTLIGGVGTVFGPVVGALTVIGLQQYLAAFDQWVPIVNGAVFVLCVMFFRRGIVGRLEDTFKKYKK